LDDAIKHCHKRQEKEKARQHQQGLGRSEDD